MTDQKHTKEIDLMQTMNGDTWAKEFVRAFIEHKFKIDLDLMRAWFCSAIMTGHDHATNKVRDQVENLRRQRDELRDFLEEFVGHGIHPAKTARKNSEERFPCFIQCEWIEQAIELIAKTKGDV